MAKAKKLDDATIRNFRLPAGVKEKSLVDGEGLYLRIRDTGAKTWLFYYTSPVTGKRPRLKIGSYPAITLSKAREEAAKHQLIVDEGKDPKIEEEQEELLSTIGGERPRTVDELFNRWSTDWLKSNHEEEGAYTKGMMNRHVLPLIGKVELDRLRSSQIVAVLTPLKNSGKARTAGVVLSSLRQMFAHAIENDWMQGDPSAAIKKSKWDTSRPRERVLTDEEVTILASKIPDADLPEAIECGIWIMLSCMTRVEETGLAQLKHIDFKKKTWFIPKENQKETNGRPPKDYWVHLSPFAEQCFRRLADLPQELAERKNARLPKSKRQFLVPLVDVDFLFPASKREGPINEKTIAHAMHDRQRPGEEPLPGRTPLVDSLVLPGGTLTPHDLRRTGSTMMRELGIPQDVIDRCLNHAESDVITATYQQAKLEQEKRAAWLKLAAHLEQLISKEAIEAYARKAAEDEEEDI